MDACACLRRKVKSAKSNHYCALRSAQVDYYKVIHHHRTLLTMSSEKNKNQEAVGSGGSRKDATDQARAMDNGYVIELRRRRLQISQQIIDLVHELLGTKELKSRFSKFEREVILSQKTPDGKVSKFLDLLERKGRDTYEMFVVALGYVKPELHLLLRQRQANGEASPSPGSPACEF